MKKLLATRLLERTETIEFRRIRSALNTAAQNRMREFRILRIDDSTVLMLQNEGLTVEKIKEHGYEKYKISW